VLDGAGTVENSYRHVQTRPFEPSLPAIARLSNERSKRLNRLIRK